MMIIVGSIDIGLKKLEIPSDNVSRRGVGEFYSIPERVVAS